MHKITIINHGNLDVEVAWDTMEDLPGKPAVPEVKDQTGKVVTPAVPATAPSRSPVHRAVNIAQAQQHIVDLAVTGKLTIREADLTPRRGIAEGSKK